MCLYIYGYPRCVINDWRAAAAAAAAAPRRHHSERTRGINVLGSPVSLLRKRRMRIPWRVNSGTVIKIYKYPAEYLALQNRRLPRAPYS